MADNTSAALRWRAARSDTVGTPKAALLRLAGLGDIKLDVRILASALIVPAVDDLGFHRTHLQMAFCQPGLM
jgi:hypothetical protein